jgi:crotonobetainyl-CoA:carnitine CoA-transferase CaiB-like acyl-CoA transferase
MDAMLAVDIWCGEVKTHLQAAADPQVRHMGMITSYEHPTAGTVKVVAPAVKLSATPAAVERPAPLVGEQTSEILRDAGYSEDEISEYLRRKIVGEPDPGDSSQLG